MGSDTAADAPVKRRGYTGQPRDPDRTTQAILAAAKAEFAEKGIGGARVDAIAERAGINKRMLYHYFGDKLGLYMAVLEEAYASIRSAELALALDRADPEEGIRTLARFTWRYFLDNPEFLSLLATENLYKAENLKRSARIPRIHSSFMGLLKSVLDKGAEQGRFKPGLDPIDVYLTIASMGAFYLLNRHTLSTVFNRDLMEPDRLAHWGDHLVEVVLSFVRR
ncbi:TetR/AcrR family transcriptional regulator [Prosthecomicrobium sp. N25]|uniref:TetR/AcrR family transcriptional regulator n=1 Tax=Prosthecomicrobium sp. N25 TaxID=3129254 RepID=UPI0030771AA8